MKPKFNFLNEIDMFGKRIELYYNGKQKKTSYFGISLTLIYVSIFLVFFIYKLVRMIKRKDSIFYDTYAYNKDPPSIELSNELFYGGFALEDPYTYDTFVDETIYYPKAYFKLGQIKGNIWDWKVKELELERCKLEKFGYFHREIFKNKPLSTFYCFKEMNETLLGHFSYDIYSFFYISLFPCVNTTDNNFHCKPLEVIDYYLTNTFLTIQVQDIEMTPQFYNSPYLARNKDIYTKVGKQLFKEIHAFFQIVNLETDIDVIGFNNFNNIKRQKLIKYESTNVMSNIIESDIYKTGEPFADVTIKLSDKVLTEKRNYTKLIDILGQIGGFMQVIFTLLRIISSFSTSIIYEISLVDNLFNFNIDKKIILIKNKNNNNNNINLLFPKEQPKMPINYFKKLSNKKREIERNREEQKFDYSKNKLNEDIFEKNKINFNNLLINNFQINSQQNSNKSRANKRHYNNSSTEIKDINIFNLNMNNIKYQSEVNRYNSMKQIDITKERLVKKLKISRGYIYFGFFCVRKGKNLNNILLDEGIKIITDKLDLLNIFKHLCINEKNDEIINMTDNCKKNIEQVYCSLYGN